MKKITKSFMTLALLMVGVVSANAADKKVLVKEFDYTGDQPFNSLYKHTDFAKTLTLADGGMKIVSPVEGVSGDKAFFIADWLVPYQGASYVFNVTLKSTVGGTVSLKMGAWWKPEGSANLTIPVTDEWTDVESTTMTNFPNAGVVNEYGGDHHVVMNIGSLEGTIIIQKVQVYQLVPEAPVVSTVQDGYEPENVLTNTDFTGDDFSCYRAKDFIIETSIDPETGEEVQTIKREVIGNPTIVDDGGVKVIKVICDEVRTPKLKEDGTQETDWAGNPVWNENAWDAQFWIRLPEQYEPGTKLLVKFDYKAAAAGTASTQTHAEPGDYIGGGFSSNISFTTDWQSFEGELTVPSHDTKKFQSITFNLNEDVEANVYYFKNISVQLPHMVTSIKATAGPAGWMTFCPTQNVSLGDVKGYGAKYENGAITLIPATELQAGEGAIIEAGEGQGVFQFMVINSAAAIEGNELIASTSTVTGDGNIYVLANGKYGVGFYRLASGAELPAGKAYLQIAAEGREFIGFAGDATTISAVKTLKESGVIYNLAGQQVKNAQKGLYIINGKKVIMK